MSDEAWKTIDRVSAVALIASIGATLFRLPGYQVVAPWLFWSGVIGIVAAFITRMVRRRRAFTEAEDVAARELDRQNRQRPEH